MSAHMPSLTRIVVAALAVAIAMPAVASRALAGDPPYLKLAQALGTPTLATSSGPKDKSQLSLAFVRAGENATTWTRMTTVSIIRIPEADTEAAKRDVIVRVRKRIASLHAHVTAFDEEPVVPVSATFAFTVKAERDAGLVYSPRAGYVTVAQVTAKNGATIAPSDLAILKRVARGNRP